MNTRISYIYRDGNNYKQGIELVVPGEIDKDFILDCCDEGEFFIPDQVGLPELQGQMINFPNDADHVWHELEDIELTDDAADTEIAAEDIERRFEEAKGNWDVCGASERLGIE